MKELAKAQNNSGFYKAVGIGIIADKAWPALCRDELAKSELHYYFCSTPKVFGTAQFLLQRIQRPPLDQWIKHFVAHAEVDHCIVHFHNAWLSGVFLPLSRLPENPTTVVVTVHGVNSHFRNQPVRQRIHQWMARRLVRYGALLTSVDRGNLRRAESLLKMSPETFTVIPNGIADTAARSDVQQVGAAPFEVGHIGSISSAKGWRILVEAAIKLREKGHAIKVTLAGRGDEARKAQELACEHQSWLSYQGFVPNPRETVMPTLDALVLMSEQEGLPMAIVEAMSVGLPVVATGVGGIPEVVTDGKTGFIIPRSVEALVESLERLIKVPEVRAKMSERARKDFEDRFEISRIVSRYHSLYAQN